MPHTHKAKKRFGQNFLIDKNIINKIVQAIAPQANQNLIEIGPGLGALTEFLLLKNIHLHAIEIDKDLIENLTLRFGEHEQFKLTQADALEFDFNQCPDDLRVVGNLPYNISTPLLFHLLKYKNKITDMHFMLQKEVVDRMKAIPNTKDYGRLSVMTQYACQVDFLFNVPPTAFRPAPQVQSSIVRLIPYKTPPFKAKDETLFADIVKQAFNQRRKTIKNALKSYPEHLAATNINPTARPETLTIQDYVNLANKEV